MKKLLIILLLPLSCWSAEYVQACRSDLNIDVDSVVLPLTTFTNRVYIWLDANAGVISALTTNFVLPDLSTNRNDATQTIINSQPTLVYTNGAWGVRTDGVDDYAVCPTNFAVMSSNISWIISADYTPYGYTIDPIYLENYVFCFSVGSTPFLGVVYREADRGMHVFVNNVGFKTSVSTLPTTRQSFRLRWDGNILSININNGGYSNIYTGAIETVSTSFYINAGRGTSSKYLKNNIHSFFMGGD